jgi:hypothetical protein
LILSKVQQPGILPRCIQKKVSCKGGLKKGWSNWWNSHPTLLSRLISNIPVMFPVETVEYMVGCVKYQTCEAGRSKMCFCLVWCLLSCSTGGGGPAWFNIEKVVCATIIMRKKSYPLAKPKHTRCSVEIWPWDPLVMAHWYSPCLGPWNLKKGSNSVMCRWKPSHDWTWLGGANDLLVEYAVVLSKNRK